MQTRSTHSRSSHPQCPDCGTPLTRTDQPGLAVCPGCGWFEGEHTRGRPVPKWTPTQVNWNQPTPIKQGAVKEGIAAGDPRDEQSPEVIPGYGYGYKILAIDSYGNLRSPSRGTLWPPYQGLSAPEPPTLNNQDGIYVTNTPTAHDLKSYNRAPGQSMGVTSVTVMAKMQISGRCVKHQNGYRAEHAIPEEIWIQPDPAVPQQDLEKLAMAVRQKYAIDVQFRAYADEFDEPPPRPPSPNRFGPQREKKQYEVATDQNIFNRLELQGAQNIRIENKGGQPIVVRNSPANVWVASGDVVFQSGKLTAAGGTVTQYGGTLVARGSSHVVFMGGEIRAGGGDGVVIEVMSPLKFMQASRNVGGGQTWRNREGSVYFTRYWRGKIVDRSQGHAQALQQALETHGDWMGPEMKKNIEGLLRHHKYISRAFEQERYISSQVEVKDDEDWTRVSNDRLWQTGQTQLAPATSSGSFYTDQQTVKCPNCAEETNMEVCPNCGKGLGPEWQKANDAQIPFDHPPQGGTPPNDRFTDVNPVPHQNWDKTDNSFPSMVSKVAMEEGQPQTTDDHVYQDGQMYGATTAEHAVADIVATSSPEQIDEIYRGVMRGDDEIWEYMRDNPLSGEWADDPRIEDIVSEAGEEIPQDENYGEYVDHYARIWTEGYHSGWLETFEEMLAVQAGKMDQAGSMTFPSEWTEGGGENLPQ